MKKSILFALTTLTAILGISAQAFAGDTTELLDHGMIEVAPTFSIDNIHDGEPSVTFSTAVGYGVTDFMTITTSFELASEIALAGMGWGFDVDLLFTPYDSENFDFDFHVDFAMGDTGLEIAPGIELNYDTDNDQNGFGAYLRLDLPIYSSITGVSDEGEPNDTETDLGLDLTLGMYYSVMEGHQLFLEGGMSASYLAKNFAEREIEGFVSLGYNALIMDNFELTSEVAVNIPEKGEGTYATISIGGIFDIPLLVAAGGDEAGSDEG